MKVWLYFLLFACSTYSFAEPAWIYEVDVTSTSSSDPVALRSGLQKVIDRLTPGVNDHENPIILSANPQTIVQSIQPRGNKQWHIKFNPQAVQSLMRQASIQPWLVNRPKLLTWVCQENMTWPTPQKHIFVHKCLAPKDAPELFKAIAQAAKDKGMELDFTGLKLIKDLPQKINQFHDDRFRDYVKKAQEENPEGILYIHLRDYPNESPFFEDSLAYYHGNFYNGKGNTKITLEETGQVSMKNVSEFLFSQGEKVEKASHPVDVRISNIHTSPAYYKVRRYLKKIPGVTKIALNSVTADAVLYTLYITVPTRLLTLRLDKKFIPLPQIPGEDIKNYRLKT